GTVTQKMWAPDFYYHFDAFLAAARSVDFVIRATFGLDRQLESWIKTLPMAEQTNRSEFESQYKNSARDFRNHLLSHVRNLSIHRAGMPSVEVTVNGRLGMAYSGGPSRTLPTMEPRPTVFSDDPGFPVGWMQSADFPLQPCEDD